MKDDLAYIEHILNCIQKIRKFSTSLTKDDFAKNEMAQDAIIRNLEIIGEATKNISARFRDNNDNIPWRSMAGLRDKLIHDYMGVDIDVVWETVNKDLPELENKLKLII